MEASAFSYIWVIGAKPGLFTDDTYMYIAFLSWKVALLSASRSNVKKLRHLI